MSTQSTQPIIDGFSENYIHDVRAAIDEAEAAADRLTAVILTKDLVHGGHALDVHYKGEHYLLMRESTFRAIRAHAMPGVNHANPGVASLYGVQVRVDEDLARRIVEAIIASLRRLE